MYELIKIENTPSGPSLRDTAIGDESVPTVSARELHKFLESKQQFSDWIKKRIEKLRLLENKDYVLILENYQIKNSRGGDRKSLHYAITLDVAKHIALMENTDKGFEVRDYFIECEKKLLSIDPETKILSKLLKSESNLETTLILKEYKEVVQAPLLEKVAQQQPKVDIYDAIIESKNTFSMANTAQIINIEKMGRNKLLAWLRAKNILKSDNTPYRAKKLCFERRRLSEGEAIIQKYINKGWFEVRVTPTVNGVKPCSRTTPKGVEGILRLLEH